MCAQVLPPPASLHEASPQTAGRPTNHYRRTDPRPPHPAKEEQGAEGTSQHQTQGSATPNTVRMARGGPSAVLPHVAAPLAARIATNLAAPIPSSSCPLPGAWCLPSRPGQRSPPAADAGSRGCQPDCCVWLNVARLPYHAMGRATCINNQSPGTGANSTLCCRQQPASHAKRAHDARCVYACVMPSRARAGAARLHRAAAAGGRRAQATAGQGGAGYAGRQARPAHSSSSLPKVILVALAWTSTSCGGRGGGWRRG